MPLHYTSDHTVSPCKEAPSVAPGPSVFEKLLDDSDASHPWTGLKTTVLTPCLPSPDRELHWGLSGHISPILVFLAQAQN